MLSQMHAAACDRAGTPIANGNIVAAGRRSAGGVKPFTHGDVEHVGE